MLTIPKILDTPVVYDAPLNYKWNSSIQNGLSERISIKLFDAILPLNHKAQIGLAVTMAEFIYWRLHKFCEKEGIDIALPLYFVEAIWPGIIDKQYAIEYPPSINTNQGTVKVNAVIYNAATSISCISARYKRGSYFMYELIPPLITLARHIAPDRDWFDNWFTDCTQRAKELFPAQYNAREIVSKRFTYKGKVYDSSNEPPICREFFFDRDFDYEKADIAALNQSYLDNLNPDNPYLNPTEKMIEQGFEGTPYKYELK